MRNTYSSHWTKITEHENIHWTTNQNRTSSYYLCLLDCLEENKLLIIVGRLGLCEDYPEQIRLSKAIYSITLKEGGEVKK